MKLTKKLTNSFILCDSCTEAIGPNYELNDIKDIYDVGPSKLCRYCYSDLLKEGFLYCNDCGEVKEVMFEDGIIRKITSFELKILQREARKH